MDAWHKIEFLYDSHRNGSWAEPGREPTNTSLYCFCFRSYLQAAVLSSCFNFPRRGAWCESVSQINPFLPSAKQLRKASYDGYSSLSTPLDLQSPEPLRHLLVHLWRHLQRPEREEKIHPRYRLLYLMGKSQMKWKGKGASQGALELPLAAAWAVAMWTACTTCSYFHSLHHEASRETPL